MAGEIPHVDRLLSLRNRARPGGVFAAADEQAAAPAKLFPYTYSVADMQKLLRAADERLEEDCLVQPATFRTLLLLFDMGRVCASAKR